jgi:hypothetical protein
MPAPFSRVVNGVEHPRNPTTRNNAEKLASERFIIPPVFAKCVWLISFVSTGATLVPLANATGPPMF